MPDKINIGELLQSKEDKERTINSLQALRAHPGWQFIIRVINLNIEMTEKQILEDVNIKPEDEKELKFQRFYLKVLRDLPYDLVQEIINPSVQKKPRIDPFE